MSIPMPASERFYQGTEWTVIGGPEENMGLRVVVTGEVYPMELKDELQVEVQVVGKDEVFNAELSWLS